MNKFIGKRVLHLGRELPSTEIVRYLQSEGAYVIVSDYLSIEENPAKQIADEALFISTNDTDTLIEYARTHKIDAVSCGASEFNLEKARVINEAIGNKFWHTQKQWQTFMSKDNFKKVLHKYGLKGTETFFSGTLDEFQTLKEDRMPVIVKPVDCAGATGVFVCFSNEELLKAAQKSTECSKSRRIIIEQYVDGREFSLTYVIQNGKINLTDFDERYSYNSHSDIQILPNVILAPGALCKEYIDKVNGHVCEMLLGESLDNCTIFLQGMYFKGEFLFFEAGLRISGKYTYSKNELINGQNYCHFLIDFLLKAQTDYDVEKEDALYKGYYSISFAYLAKAGVISKMEGISELKSRDNVKYVTMYHSVGDEIKENVSFRRMLVGYTIVGRDPRMILEEANNIRKSIKILDENGSDMIDEGFVSDELCQQINVDLSKSIQV